MSRIASIRRARLLAGFAPQAAVAASQPAALDITDIRHYPVREPVSGNRYSLLRVTTRSGVTGWGECRHDPNADIKTLQTSWTGKPANAYATIASSTPFRAALDLAMLDILGK